MITSSLFAVSLGVLSSGLVNFLSYKVPLGLEKKILLDSSSCLLGSGREEESSAIDKVIDEIPRIQWKMIASFYYRLAITGRSLVIAVLCLTATLTCFSLWPALVALAYSVFFITLALLSIIDWEHQTLPDELTQPLLWFGIVLSLIGVIELSLSESVIGALTGYLIFDVMAKGYRLVKREVGLGQGDVKLMAAVGSWLGFKAVIDMLPYVFAISFLFYFVSYRGMRGVAIPFGPSIAMGALIVVLIDSDVLRFSSMINL